MTTTDGADSTTETGTDPTAEKRIADRLEISSIDGDVDIDPASAIAKFDLVERQYETQCGSGDRIEGRWRGIELAELLDGIDADATHLVVESEDGFRVCVPIADAIAGILAVDRIDTEGFSDSVPRFVAPSLSATRLVRRVVKIEGKQLSPSDDPGDFEDLSAAESS